MHTDDNRTDNLTLAHCLTRTATLRLRTRESHDVYAHAASLSAWEQDYAQLTPGRFRGLLREFWTPSAQVFSETVDQGVRQRCTVWEGALWFGIPERDDGTRMNGRHVPDGAIMVQAGGDPFELCTPPGHGICGIVVRKEQLVRHCDRRELDPDWHRLGRDGLLAATPAARAALLATLHGLFDRVARRDPADADTLETHLLDALLPFIAAPARPVRPGSPARRHQAVHAILDKAGRDPAWTPDIPELCRMVHMSRRSLQNAFEEVTGMSPALMLRTLRLNGARHALATGHAASVQAAAGAHGFWNPSQFSADYHRLFGERPSDTRCKASHGMAGKTEIGKSGPGST